MNSNEIIKIIGRSFVRALKGRVWKFIFGSSVTSFIGYLLIANRIVQNTKISSVWVKYALLIPAIFLIILFIVRFFIFLTGNFYEHFHNKFKESKYGDAIVVLKDSFAHIHSLRKKEEITNQDFMITLKTVCDNVKEIFDKLTKTQCCVSIKVPISDTLDASHEVVNLCRDRNNHIRDTNNYKETKHSIVGNTAYSTIINNINQIKRNKFFYINNDIPADKEKYLNTSKHLYPDDVLPYKSELVCPIIPLLSDVEPKYELLGFICIDSGETDKFEKEYHVAIVQGVADGIYDIIKKRHSLKK